MVRRKFEAAIMEVGIEGATAHAWLNSTMHGIESLCHDPRLEGVEGIAGRSARADANQSRSEARSIELLD
jgi:hypothetical protein